MSDTAKLLRALRNRHDSIESALGDDGLYGAMSRYTGRSHLNDAVRGSLLKNTLMGAGTGALAISLVSPTLGVPISTHLNKRGLLYGAGAGAALGTLNSIAKYYLGQGAASMSQNRQ